MSDPILIKKSVPQRGPLSLILFNLAIDYIYRELCDKEFANIYGYRLKQDQTALSLTGFADDQAVTSTSIDNMIRMIELINNRFREIGLEINPSKSVIINVKNGRLISVNIKVND